MYDNNSLTYGIAEIGLDAYCHERSCHDLITGYWRNVAIALPRGYFAVKTA